MPRMKIVEIDTFRYSGMAFDFEGTITNSYWAHHEARKRVFAAHGLAGIADEQHYHGPRYGATNYGIIGGILKSAGIIDPLAHAPTNPTVRALVQEKHDAFMEITGGELDPQPGAVERLHQLGPLYAGRLAIVTNALKEVVTPFLEQHDLDYYFESDDDDHDLVVTEETLVRKGHDFKPLPDPYLLAMCRMGIDTYNAPGGCLVFEDSVSGATSASGAGASLCVVSSRETADTFAHLRPEYFATSLAQVNFSPAPQLAAIR